MGGSVVIKESSLCCLAVITSTGGSVVCWAEKILLFGEQIHFEATNNTFEFCWSTCRASAVSFLPVGTPLIDLNDNQIIMKNNDNRKEDKSRREQ